MDELTALRERAQAADRGELPGAPAPASNEPGAPPAPLRDPAQDWIDFAQQVGRVARTLPLRGFSEWTDARLDEFGRALARCAEHYGWTFGHLVTHPITGLALAAFPLVWPVAEPFVKAKLTARQPAAREEKEVKAPLDGAP